MKQTAVDWLFNRLWETPKNKLTWYSILEEAKQREKEQIQEAFWEQPFHDDTAFERYYKETYGEDGDI